MSRCLHIYDSGFQCVGDSLEPSEFCESHQTVALFERLDDSPGRKFLFRVVALILLLLFLVPLVFGLRALYFGPEVKAQEVW